MRLVIFVDYFFKRCCTEFVPNLCLVSAHVGCHPSGFTSCFVGIFGTL